MAVPTGSKYISNNSCRITRSAIRQVDINAKDNGVSCDRYQAERVILPISNNLSNNTSVLTRSMSRTVQLFAGKYEIPGDSKEKKANTCRKKHTFIIPDLSKCHTASEEHVPGELKKEAECLSPEPLFHKYINSETSAKQQNTTKRVLVTQNEHPRSTPKSRNESSRWELPSSTTIQDDLNSETSAMEEGAKKQATPYEHHRNTSKSQNETSRWELPSSTTIQDDLNSETSAMEEGAKKQATPYEHHRNTSKIKSATKLPNFASIHKKQFEKMESVIEWKQRNQTRSDRMLMSPTAKGTFCFKNLPSEPSVKENVFKFTAIQNLSSKNQGVGKKEKYLNMKKKTNLEEMKKFRSKQNIVIAAAKENLIKKLPHVSREQKRAEERNFLKGVRLNKRFHLQMEMRKLQ